MKKAIDWFDRKGSTIVGVLGMIALATLALDGILYLWVRFLKPTLEAGGYGGAALALLPYGLLCFLLGIYIGRKSK